MKNTNALAALTLLILGMLIFVLCHHTAPVQASGPEQVLRGRALELFLMPRVKCEHPFRSIPKVRGARLMVRPLNTATRLFPRRSYFVLFVPTDAPR
jgi:hypothetical protein